MRTSNLLDESTRSSLFNSNYYKRPTHASSEFKKASLSGNDQPFKTFINLEIITTGKKSCIGPKNHRNSIRFQQCYRHMKDKIRTINTHIEEIDIPEEIPDKHSPKVFHISPTSLKVASMAKCPNSDRSKHSAKHFEFKGSLENDGKIERSPSNTIIREKNQLCEN